MVRAMLRHLLQAATRGLRHAAGALLALLILFEEWGWDPLQRALARLGRLPLLRQVEALVAGLPPRWALLVFVLPTLALLPVKLLALGLIARGQPLLGLLVILAAKLLGTAVVARLFSLTQPALLQLPWFASAFSRWTTWKDALLARVRASWAWRSGRVLRHHLRRRLKHSLARWRQG